MAINALITTQNQQMMSPPKSSPSDFSNALLSRDRFNFQKQGYSDQQAEIERQKRARIMAVDAKLINDALANNDTERADALFRSRLNSLQMEGRDHSHTQAAYDLFRSGNLPELKAGLDQVVAAAEAEGLYGNTGMTEYQRQNLAVQNRRLDLMSSLSPKEQEKLDQAERRLDIQQQQYNPGVQGEISRAKAKGSVEGKYEAETATGAAQDKAKLETILSGSDNVIDTIDKALSEVDWSTSGIIGAVVSNVPGTPQYDVSELLGTIKANVGFDRLQQMRDMSKTGGALGQVAVQEIDALQRTIQSLKQGQSPRQLRENLVLIREHYKRATDLMKKMHAERYGEESLPEAKEKDYDLEYDPATGAFK